MHHRAIVVVALILASSIAGATAHAAPSAGKTVIRIDAAGAPSGGNPNGGGGRFTLRAGRATDRGSDSYAFAGSSGRLTLTGRHGTLFLKLKRTRSGLSVDSEGLDLWTGTWSVSGGTGVYDGVTGVGAFLGVIGPSYRVAFHLEGFLPGPLGG
jgi:hypothetical protein